MRSILCVLLFRLLALPSSEDELRMEILALRHQIQAFKRGHPKPRIGARFRIYWVLLSRWWSRWKSACVLVKPETVIRWHRVGFRLFWRWKSREPAGRRPRKELISLVRQMAVSNPGWGAPRIHGELLKLGFQVSERTVSRFMPKRTYRGDDLMKHRQTWRAFLLNHREVITAMDFLHYYHHDRPHLGLGKDCPRGRPIEVIPAAARTLEALPRCGGLHHRYVWRKVA
jgi:putative transposase